MYSKLELVEYIVDQIRLCACIFMLIFADMLLSLNTTLFPVCDHVELQFVIQITGNNMSIVQIRFHGSYISALSLLLNFD